MFSVDLNFENNDQVFNTFHSIFALDTGQLNISAWLTDWDKINENSVKWDAKKKTTGKHLTVSISDNYRYGDYMECKECASGDEGFSLGKLRKKNQSDWTEQDYKIARKIIECYVEFVLSGDKYYNQTEKITKNEDWYKMGGLLKASEPISNLDDLKGWRL